MRTLLAFVLLVACGGTENTLTPRADASPEAADVVVAPDVAPVAASPLDSPPEAAVDASHCSMGRAVCDCPDGSRRFAVCAGEVPGPCPCADDGGVDAVAEVAVDAPADIAPEAACASMTPGNCCGVACPVGANATAATCAAGRCGLTCRVGRGDCDGNASNGCEVDLAGTNAHCGACGAPCAAGRVCNGAAACESACRAGLSACATGCVDRQNDRANCGTCGRVCETREMCVSGRCT